MKPVYILTWESIFQPENLTGQLLVSELLLPLFRPQWPIVVFIKPLFSLDISKSTKWTAEKIYRTLVYHNEAFTPKILLPYTF